MGRSNGYTPTIHPERLKIPFFDGDCDKFTRNLESYLSYKLLSVGVSSSEREGFTICIGARLLNAIRNSPESRYLLVDTVDGYLFAGIELLITYDCDTLLLVRKV